MKGLTLWHNILSKYKARGFKPCIILGIWGNKVLDEFDCGPEKKDNISECWLVATCHLVCGHLG